MSFFKLRLLDSLKLEKRNRHFCYLEFFGTIIAKILVDNQNNNPNLGGLICQK